MTRFLDARVVDPAGSQPCPPELFGSRGHCVHNISLAAKKISAQRKNCAILDTVDWIHRETSVLLGFARGKQVMADQTFGT